ncbi:hypothetical protein EON65_06065 [archaeon]|nr:MAG: hypothetical protein EON65_06065 [archaeon]
MWIEFVEQGGYMPLTRRLTGTYFASFKPFGREEEDKQKAARSIDGLLNIIVCDLCCCLLLDM